MARQADVIMCEVRRIVAEELASSRPVSIDDELADFPELDSLGLLTLAVGLEDRFRVKLTGADAQGIATVRDLVDLIESRLVED